MVMLPSWGVSGRVIGLFGPTGDDIVWLQRQDRVAAAAFWPAVTWLGIVHISGTRIFYG